MPERKPYDAAYKLLFSHKSIFHQFLTRFVDKEVFKNLRVDDLELVPPSFISDHFKRREADIIYRVRVATGHGRMSEQAEGRPAPAGCLHLCDHRVSVYSR